MNNNWTEVLENARETQSWQEVLYVMVDSITGQEIVDMLDTVQAGQPLDKKQKWQIAAILNQFIDDRLSKL